MAVRCPSHQQARRGPAIPASGVYLGTILLEEQSSPPDFNRRTGVRHAAFMTFVDFPEVNDPRGTMHAKAVRFLDACREARAFPVITVECFGGLDSYGTDDVLRFADLLHGSGRAAIIRWNHEMNGSWYPWGQQPEKYIERFRQFAVTLREAAPVALAWTPNQGWGYPWPGCKHHNPRLVGGDPYAPYYPGDEYADWVGLSFYHWGERRGANEVPPPDKWAQALGFGNPVPNFHDLYAARRGKPMMIAETSALYDTGNRLGGGASEYDIKRSWIAQVYDEARLRRDLPWLKAIFWFSILKREKEVGGDVDWRLDANAEVADFYRETVSTPYFLQPS